MYCSNSFPNAIIHIDGDSFFASCEIAKNPQLKGKPVITGKERGIVSSMSYEAKRLGITRAMRLSDIKKICPEAIILPSDYETYSLYSKRMYEIVRRYTPDIEEYSIDECFADLTGMRRVNKMSYESMAIHIKHDLDTELGMTFSIGLSVNKVLAKIGSKWKKPSGLTIISSVDIEKYISALPVGKVWGIGPNTSAYLNKYGIITAYDFAKKDVVWVREHLSKPFQEIHAELNGTLVYHLNIGEKHDYASVSKTKTFTPASSDKAFVFSQLSKNIENACIKLRRHDLYTDRCVFFLKTQDFHYHNLDITFANTTCIPQDILSIVREKFNMIFKTNTLYRATGIVLMNLSHNYSQTIDLFGNYSKSDKIKKVYEAVDKVSHKYGKHSVFIGSSLLALNVPSHSGERSIPTERNKNLLKGETSRKRIGIPFLGKVF